MEFAKPPTRGGAWLSSGCGSRGRSPALVDRMERDCGKTRIVNPSMCGWAKHLRSAAMRPDAAEVEESSRTSKKVVMERRLSLGLRPFSRRLVQRAYRPSETSLFAPRLTAPTRSTRSQIGSFTGGVCRKAAVCAGGETRQHRTFQQLAAIGQWDGGVGDNVLQACGGDK